MLGYVTALACLWLKNLSIWPSHYFQVGSKPTKNDPCIALNNISYFSPRAAEVSYNFYLKSSKIPLIWPKFPPFCAKI